MGEAGVPAVAVVPMRARHLRGVVAIELQTSHRPWSRDLFASELKQASSRCVAAVRADGAVVGFGCLMSTRFEAHVTNIATDPASQGQGIATLVLLRLVAEAVDWGLDDLTLEVRRSNDVALRLYGRFGFQAEGVRPRYYAETNEDAIIMWARGLTSDDYRSRLEVIAADVGALRSAPLDER